MILLFSPRLTNRLQYVIKTVISEICGFDYKVTNSGEEFLNFRGARINYSDRDFPVESIRICPSGFLLEKGIHDFTPQIEIKNGFPRLFPHKNSNIPCDLGYDIFSLAFYMLSRYEEYLPYLEDRHGRFEADQSLAYQHGFLDMPIVDLAAKQLRSLLMEKFPYLESSPRRFSFLPTYDVDVAYAYKGKGLARNLFLITRDIFTFNFPLLRDRFNVLTGREKDPFDSFDFQLQLQKTYRLKPVYFFLCAPFGPNDRGISVHSRIYQRLVKTMSDYAQTGIHPSYASHTRPTRLTEETAFLADILNRPIENSRQHYLKFKLPYTYQNLIKNNIKTDYSMGYASHTGFRAGTSHEFSFFDLTVESETRLRIVPISIMDGTLRDYMKLGPMEALEKGKKLIDIVRSVNGKFVSLWHNDALGEHESWKGWRNVYVELVRYATEASVLNIEKIK